jgi:hypothetical protein
MKTILETSLPVELMSLERHMLQHYPGRVGRHLKRSMKPAFWDRAAEVCIRWDVSPALLVYAVYEFVNWEADQGAVEIGSGLFRSEVLMKRALNNLQQHLEAQEKIMAPVASLTPAYDQREFMVMDQLGGKCRGLARLMIRYCQFMMHHAWRKCDDGGVEWNFLTHDLLLYHRYKGNPYLLLHLALSEGLKEFARYACKKHLEKNPWCMALWGTWLNTEELNAAPDLQKYQFHWPMHFLRPDELGLPVRGDLKAPELTCEVPYFDAVEHSVLTATALLAEHGAPPDSTLRFPRL